MLSNAPPELDLSRSFFADRQHIGAAGCLQAVLQAARQRLFGCSTVAAHGTARRIKMLASGRHVMLAHEPPAAAAGPCLKLSESINASSRIVRRANDHAKIILLYLYDS